MIRWSFCSSPAGLWSSFYCRVAYCRNQMCLQTLQDLKHNSNLNLLIRSMIRVAHNEWVCTAIIWRPWGRTMHYNQLFIFLSMGYCLDNVLLSNHVICALKPENITCTTEFLLTPWFLLNLVQFSGCPLMTHATIFLGIRRKACALWEDPLKKMTFMFFLKYRMMCMGYIVRRK
jgi:hypothetical protein